MVERVSRVRLLCALVVLSWLAIPPACADDCNSNGVADEYDIAGATSNDCNNNAVPDECDIMAGTSDDCGENTVPDECDIASGTADDCNSSGIPDTCELLPAGLAFEHAKLTPSADAARGRFGRSGAVSGGFAIFGERTDDGAGYQAGSAYIYRRIGTRWEQEAKLVASDAGAEDSFGFSVAIKGVWAVVGTLKTDRRGSVYVFRRDDATWIEEAILRGTSNGSRDFFGWSVATDADAVVVGAPNDLLYEFGVGWRSGAAYVFRRSGATWALEDRLIGSGVSASSNWFGRAVDLSGNWLVVGDVGDPSGGTRSGAAYVFRNSESGWEEEAKLTAPNPAAYDLFGCSVSMAGNILAVGAYGDDERGDSAGAVYVFRHDGVEWRQEAKLFASDAASDQSFGLSVSVRNEFLIVGACGDNEMAWGAGAAYVFRHDGVDWRQETKLVASDAAAEDAFGLRVSTDGEIALVISPNDDDHGEDAGAAYTYALVPDCNMNEIPDVCDVAAGTSADCNVNRIPDDCEIDCNTNGVPDGCDLAGASSDDCNSNSVPDECDIGSDVSRDCQTNGVPDECELTRNDCNGNGVPDECDLSAGTSADADESGLLDECEFDCAVAVRTKLLASDGAPGDGFGTSVSLSGDVGVIGAVWDNDNGSDSGSAYVFRWDGSGWGEEAKLTASDGAEDDWFGESVSISGDTIVVGAKKDDDSGTDSGSAYAFRYTGSVWDEEAKLTASDGDSQDYFGVSVSVSGNVAVIGAVWDDDSGSDSGSAYVFRHDGSAWVEEAKLTASDGSANDWFGNTVSLSGDTAVIGAAWDSDIEPFAGSAYVFRYDGLVWEQEAKLTASDGAAQDVFGGCVSISGDTVVVGAPWDDDNGSYSGSAYVFRYDGLAWSEEAKLTASDGAADDWFGSSIFVSGDTIIIGASWDNDNGSSSGSAYVFRRDGAVWVEEVKLTAFDGAVEDYFGYSVSLSGNTVLIGAYEDDDHGSKSGSAYVLRMSWDDCNENGVTDLCDIAAGTSADVNLDGVPDECGLLPADFDIDGDVDLDDYAFFVGCLTGPLVSPPGDHDEDGDVDLDDFGEWQVCLTGPGVPIEAGCEPHDLDVDGDVDIADFAILQDAFTGEVPVMPPGCEPADFDADSDIDLGDFGVFQQSFTG